MPDCAQHSLNEVRQEVVRYVDAPLRDAVSTLAQPLRRMAEYHFGWVEADGTAADPHGRILRRRAATLTFLASGSPGSAWERARAVAAANTLLMASALVHDDLVDHDECRYGRAAVWKAFGAPAAVHLGDALLALAFRTLRDAPAGARDEIQDRMAACAQTMYAGQAAETLVEQNRAGSLEQVIDVAAAKAGNPVEYFVASGVLCSGAPADSVSAAAEFGLSFGMAFQFRNDLENIWDNPHGDLHDPLSDLRERRVTAPVAFAWQQPGPVGDELAAYYQAKTVADYAELLRIRGLLEQAGARTWLETVIATHMRTALELIPRITTDPRTAAQLSALVRSVDTGTDMSGLVGQTGR
ncbi:polyprenyl synthetase family protein [Segniliparus rugosus]|uniref:Polyprenyl synthetase n=1 Tax=Segniliparus rugosus (strain ATCC BAA-974 / DSM 45345 / CCUG 50838 / CIP 108380 / JCM 13579 / CDC 945) TaxID=679197 RepID=E5XM64_SEGRC|nr:polyprenyl synthetase family protein [Segniliparus rugosus]EFV14554.1 hypothetical protein HMPREF9336_00584 [Segniliparus rugosus ATCC BAA-974]